MNEDKKNQLKESLDKAKKELEKMKASDPTGKYEQYEIMIEKLTSLIDGKFSKYMIRRVILKVVCSLIVVFFAAMILVGAVFGFTHSLLNQIPPLQFLYIIPSISLVLVILMHFVIYLTNRIEGNSFVLLLIFSIIAIIGLGTIDALWIHLGGNMDSSFFLAFILWISFMGLDFWIQRKFFL